MSQSRKKKCEIAEKLVRHMLQEKGIGSLEPGNLREELEGVAEQIEVESDDLIEFVHPIYEDLLKEALKNDRS